MRRRTIQRALTLEAVERLPGHPTAEEAYQYAVRQAPAISRGTVYRNLALLAQQGAVRRITMPDGADRFDRETAPHYHLICQSCGRFIDAPFPYLAEADGQIARQTGWQCLGHTVLFQGLCPDCLNEPAETNNQNQEETTMSKYRCTICNYIYDEAAGDEANGVAPGTKWEDLPEDYLCPICSVGKDQFEKED